MFINLEAMQERTNMVLKKTRNNICRMSGYKDIMFTLTSPFLGNRTQY